METLAYEFWALWWVWGIGAIALLVLEIFAPGFLFLGFGIGAAVVALLLGIGVLPNTFPVLTLIFSVISMISWFVMRRVFGVGDGNVKVWDTDINEDV